MIREGLPVEFHSPEQEDASLKFQLALLEEAGIHELLPQLREMVTLRSLKSKTGIDLQARVRNAVILAHRFSWAPEDHDLVPEEVEKIGFASIRDDFKETEGVRTSQGPFLRVNFYYDLGMVTTFERKRKRDEVSVNPTSYQAISIETSPSREMRVYHFSFMQTTEAVGGEKVKRAECLVDRNNAFVFPYYTQIDSAAKYGLNVVPVRGGWSSHDSGDIGIFDHVPLASSLKVPNAALYLLSQHPPRHIGGR